MMEHPDRSSSDVEITRAEAFAREERIQNIKSKRTLAIGGLFAAIVSAALMGLAHIS